ncbi:arylamine N-acetyltransferase family protein [Thermoactinospora rubra]|uniref:arylamine N-acetyltransferase family protein n=1 Tax=Thermoactinospora rubra TaxID=1088767 RepID=UPI001180788E|nr:arylamine N-acetyltransferase [Thermoactinospora rubra]
MDVASYLHRLGRPDLLGAPPTLETLHAVHTAHVERVPYECLEIWLGRPTTVDPLESAGRILRGRGGYCYHLNGALSALLAAMGFEVARHVGGVQNHRSRPGVTGNHLPLTVTLPEGAWLVDVGLGDGPHEPLPLVAGRHRQGPFEYGLRPSEVAPGGWRLDHDPAGAFAGMDFGLEPTDMTAFTDMHRHLSTSPESGFVQAAVVYRRDASGVDCMRGLVLSRIGNASTSTTMERPEDYYAALADVFGLTLDDVPPEARDKLWARLARAHERWLAGG